ncbi:MAG: prenyltransferase [Acidobacteria bacterium]|nr:prenyltransferase [Acidobacteriota bacterium]
MTKITAFLGVARAPFLLLPVALVLCGAGAAAYGGSVRWDRTVLALVGLVALHAAVNIFNEISDYRRGIDMETTRTPFSGGSGTLPGGELSPSAAVIFGVCMAAAGAAIGVYFLVVVGRAFVPLLVIGAVSVLGYTDFLARAGLGEISAGLGLGGLAVAGTALVQDGHVGPAALAASVPAFLMTFNLLLLNEFPDEQADDRGGRRNLVLILGRRRAALAWTVAALLVPAWLVAAVMLGLLPPAALAACLPSLLLVPAFRWAFGNPAADVPTPALGANVAWNLVTNAVLGLTLFLVS